MPFQSTLSRLNLVILLSFLAFGARSAAAAGVLDTGFGQAGRASVSAGYGAVATEIAADGNEIVVAGNYTRGRYGNSAFVYRFTTAGIPKAGFGIDGLVRLASGGLRLSIRDIEMTNDGSIVAAGTALAGDGSSDLFVLRLLRNGLLDTAFGEGGLALIDVSKTDDLGSIAVLADGSVVAAASSRDEGVSTAVIKVRSDGRPASDFGDEGVALYRFPNASFFAVETPSDIEVLPSGALMVGGDWEFTLDGVERVGSYLVQFGRDGAPQGLDATPYVEKQTYPCRGSFDGMVTDDGRYLTVGRQGGINPFHDGSKLFSLPGGRIAAAGGCLGGGLKIYSADDLHLIGADLDLDAKSAVAMPDGSIAVLTRSVEVTVLKGVTSAGTRHQNFSGGNRADLAVFRKSERTLYVNDARGRSFSIGLGADATRIIPERAVFLSSNEGVKRGTVGYWNIFGKIGSFGIVDGSGGSYLNHSAGTEGDIPFAGDFDADGAIDTGVFRGPEGNWYQKIHFASEHFGEPVKWGVPGDRPVPADYDGDGRTDIAVYRPSNGTWWIRRSSDGGVLAVQFGIAADIPLTGDFDADGRADLTVYRPDEGNWYQFLSSEGSRVVKFGIASDIPVPADYDGDGRFDIAVFREGVWYLLQSRDGFAAVQWGSPGDKPVTVRYDE